jgi:hypothetical protein
VSQRMSSLPCQTKALIATLRICEWKSSLRQTFRRIPKKFEVLSRLEVEINVAG